MRQLSVAVCVLGLMLATVGGRAFSESDGLAVSIQISPHVIVLGSEAVWVTVHADISYGSVSPGSVKLSGVSAKLCFADDRGDLVAKFTSAQIKDIVGPPEATLVLTGETKDGASFSGSETVKVVSGK